MKDRTPSFAVPWALFLDVDGTLLEIVEHPEDVRVTPNLRAILADLLRLLDGAVALVSGRPIASLDRFFSPLRPPAAGQHGLERRDGRARIHYHRDEGHALDAARQRLQTFVRTHPRAVIEDKTLAVALHYRRAPAAAGEARALMYELLEGLAPDYELQEGKMVLEIKPAGRNKGTVVREFMAEPPFAGRVPVFIGDDVTDEDGFDAVMALGGIAVKVGPGESMAPWRLRDSGRVLDWLRQYVEFCSEKLQRRAAE